MKQLYLICRLNPKDKLTVIQKVTTEELKQIELKVTLAKKINSEMETLNNKLPVASEDSKEYLRLIELSREELNVSDPYDYLEQFDQAIVLPYIKILE